MQEKKFNSFEEFYPYYKDEHKKTGTRITHFIGTSLFFIFVIMSIITHQPLYILYGVISAYGFAWIGHFFIEKNKPATFQYPLMSLRGDFKLYFQILLGKESIMEKKQE